MGELLRWASLLASHHTLSLSSIALANLEKVHHRAVQLGFAGLPTFDASEGADIGGYQALARHTDQESADGYDPLALSVPMLGLAGESGSLMVALKKRFRGDEPGGNWGGFIQTELGDLLWYMAACASHASLDLLEIAADDLERARRSRQALGQAVDRADLPVLDAGYPSAERFPRRMLLRFQEGLREGRPEVTLTLIAADPNAFPDGPIPRSGGKSQGFAVRAQLGDKVTDNSSANDAYRYHDAVHLGFVAVMGWSPNLRQLLGLKRKSDPLVDENEDGARAVFAEEGLSALLAKRAPDSQGFANPRLVPDDLVEIMTTVLEDLEVSKMPPWLWREAISQGFSVMGELEAGKGGFVVADLDRRSLVYMKVPPRFLGDVEIRGAM
ncbi:hypothetical protein [Terracoccus sp. 273MFTsu3.1]|uniref:hypothetical protein n=1 Tax=Terracoccus sp. 273MFTsu3.1 TaxID=1172188 RepID=UPI0012DF776F|nr:hypothetical protein [Terracoccus sp. 273MFTsu3.1]